MSPVLADGYNDENGNWIEDPPPYDPWTDASPDLDTDSDGINDYEEVWGVEINWVSGASTLSITTNPTIPDTDGDGLPDGWERENGLNPAEGSD